MERSMLQMPQVPLVHIDHFSPGVYARELRIPKGVTLTGRIHKYTNLNILAKGSIAVTMEDGQVHVIHAGEIVVSPPGTKRIATTIEDCVWITILGTDETDTDKIEQHFTTNDEAEYLAFAETLKIEGE